MKKVIMTINPKTNEVTYEIQGVGGIKCTELTDLLTQGSEVKEQRFTEEYHVPEVLPEYTNE